MRGVGVVAFVGHGLTLGTVGYATLAHGHIVSPLRGSGGARPAGASDCVVGRV